MCSVFRMATATYNSIRYRRIDHSKADIIVLWSSNAIYHIIIWFITIIIFVVIFYSTDLIFDRTYSDKGLIDAFLQFFIDPFYNGLLIVLWLSLTLDYIRILRLQIDLRSRTIVWEKISLRNICVAQRELSDVHAVLQPRESLFLPQPARLELADESLPIEIRRPWRQRSAQLAGDLAAMTDLPLVNHSGGTAR